jgi:preprotein translocase subunit SecE
MKKIVQFCKESIAELKKVVWPTREEIGQSTKVVLISTVVIALILGLMDFLFTKGMTIIF